MKYRQLGRLKLDVSEIGFGCWGIGGLTEGATSYGETSDDRSIEALNKAFELGINFYDTSNVYGNGHSEELLGEVFQPHRSKLILASKAGFLRHDGPQEFSESYLRKSLEGSLRRLRTTYLDLLQLHSPPLTAIASSANPFKTLQKFREEGLVRAIGISSRSPEEGLEILQRFDFDVIQVNFNLVDQRAHVSGLFDYCQRKGVGVAVRTPLCFGFLSGLLSPESPFSSRDHRSRWSVEQRQLWNDAAKLFATQMRDYPQTDAQLALRFCLSFKVVSTVIPGMLNMKEVVENIQASMLPPFTQAELYRIKNLYETNTFFLGKTAAVSQPS